MNRARPMAARLKIQMAKFEGCLWMQWFMFPFSTCLFIHTHQELQFCFNTWKREEKNLENTTAWSYIKHVPPITSDCWLNTIFLKIIFKSKVFSPFGNKYSSN